MARGRSQYRDPYWTTARFDGKDANGQPVKKGARIFYFPNGRQVFQGEAAEREARSFEAARQDEAFMRGEG